MNKELETRYNRISAELEKYLVSNEAVRSKNKIKANVCNVSLIDLENIVSKINTNTLVATDVFFRSIKPIVKTALTTISLWNYLLETPIRTIDTIREFEDQIKNEISDLKDFNHVIKSQMVTLIYIMLFLIKNRADLRITDLVSIVGNVMDIINVITDLSENCPLVKDTINTMFGDISLSDEANNVKDILNDIVGDKSFSTDVDTTTFNSTYVDGVINVYRQIDPQMLDYNLDNYLEKLIDFIDRIVSNFFALTIDTVNLQIDVQESLITDSADKIVDTIMGLGFGDFMISKQKLDTCLRIITKYDTTNKKEYESYYEKINRIPKSLNMISVNNKPYIINKAKLYMLIIDYYFAKQEELEYNYLMELIDNLYCVVDSTADEITGKNNTAISKKDQNSIRSFTFFAIYYYGAGVIIDFLNEEINNSSIADNSDFQTFIAIKVAEEAQLLEREYYSDIQVIDEKIYNSVDELVEQFPEITTEERVGIIDRAKTDLQTDYDSATKVYEEKLSSVEEDTFNYYVNNTEEIDNLALRQEVENNTAIVDELSQMKDSLNKFYFTVSENISNVAELLSQKDYRDVIDNITANGTNTELNLETVVFFNDQMLFDLFGDQSFFVNRDIGLEEKVNSFISSSDMTGSTPSLQYMIDRYSSAMKFEEKSYASSDNLKTKLTNIVDRYFSEWKKYNVNDILAEYYDILKEINNPDATLIDYNGVKDVLGTFLELTKDAVDDFAETYSSDKYEFKNSVYNVDVIEKFHRMANLQVESFINEL